MPRQDKDIEPISKNYLILNQYRIALDYSSIVSKTDPKGNITYVNEKFEVISGYTQAELLGVNHNILRHPDMPAQTFKDLWRTISHKKTWQGIVKNRKKDGSSYTVNSVIMPILDENNHIIEYISIRNDITALLQQQKLINQQQIDNLTNLPSRSALLADIENNQLTMVALVDICNFKFFNDFYGIDVGDKILIEVVSWLTIFAQKHHLKVYRVFGDRFAITPLTPCQGANGIENSCTVEGFIETLEVLWSGIEQELFDINHEIIDIEVTIGLATGHRYLLPLAESALNIAKNNFSGKKITLFNEQSVHQQDYLKWIHLVRDALSDGRIINYYQPIVNPKNASEIKYEALVRLIKQDGSVVLPFFFLDIIKKTRYYQKITRTVFDQALDFSLKNKVQVSINLSIKDIENIGLRDYILEQLSTHQGGMVTLEITESESIQDYTTVKSFIRNVQQHGAKIAIDDFGSGYSNFSYLVEMKTDYLKIDGSLIKNILTDNNSLLVIESIVDVARKLKIKVVAEFVSDEAIADKLKSMGVDYLQGFYYGAPKEIAL
jgi:PAS domain S-box-containing protein